MHRDLKATNILYTTNGEVKIADFGMARVYTKPHGKYTPKVVTMWYRSPEVLLGTKEYDEKCDIWSLGCMFGELIKGDGIIKGEKELDQMIKKLKDEKCDFVFASRYEKDCGSEDDTLITLVGNYIFTFIGKIFFKLNITDILYTFVMARASCAKELKLTAKDFSFCVELPIKAHRASYKICTSKSFERSRIAGKKKVNAFKDGLKILFSMIKLFFRHQV